MNIEAITKPIPTSAAPMSYMVSVEVPRGSLMWAISNAVNEVMHILGPNIKTRLIVRNVELQAIMSTPEVVHRMQWSGMISHNASQHLPNLLGVDEVLTIL